MGAKLGFSPLTADSLQLVISEASVVKQKNKQKMPGPQQRHPSVSGPFPKTRQPRPEVPCEPTTVSCRWVDEAWLRGTVPCVPKCFPWSHRGVTAPEGHVASLGTVLHSPSAHHAPPCWHYLVLKHSVAYPRQTASARHLACPQMQTLGRAGSSGRQSRFFSLAQSHRAFLLGGRILQSEGKGQVSMGQPGHIADRLSPTRAEQESTATLFPLNPFPTRTPFDQNSFTS